MAFQALATFASWSHSPATAEHLLMLLLDGLRQDLHLCHSEHPPFLVQRADDDDGSRVCDDARFLSALDTLVALVAEDGVLEHDAMRDTAVRLLNAVCLHLSDDHLGQLDRSAAFAKGGSDALPLLAVALQGRVGALGERFWQALVHDAMGFAQPPLQEWAQQLVPSSGLVMAAAVPSLPTAAAAEGPAAAAGVLQPQQPGHDHSLRLRYLLGRASTFQQVWMRLEAHMTLWGLCADSRDRLMDAALQTLINVAAEERQLAALLQAPAARQDSVAAAAGCGVVGLGVGVASASIGGGLAALRGAGGAASGLLRVASERQHLAEHMLLVLLANEDTADGDVVRHALDLPALHHGDVAGLRGGLGDEEADFGDGLLELEGDPMQLRLTDTCRIALWCATAQLRFARTVLAAAGDVLRCRAAGATTAAIGGGGGGERAADALARLRHLLEWYGSLHCDDARLFAPVRLSTAGGGGMRAAGPMVGGAAVCPAIYASAEFTRCLAALCECLGDPPPPPSAAGHGAMLPPEPPKLRLRLQAPARFRELAALLPPRPFPTMAVTSGLALLCSAFLLCCCLTPALAAAARWFAKAVPAVYLRHPVVAAAAVGFLERKLDGDFCADAIAVLLGGEEVSGEGSAAAGGAVGGFSAVASALV